jgi:hypothetical protein
MCYMFEHSQFDGDLSKWDVSSVMNMSFMFYNSQFNNPSLLTWDVSSVMNMSFMFYNSTATGDLSQWDVSNVETMRYMFKNSKIKKK